MKDGTTRGEKKILLQFEKFTETDDFTQEVKRIRKTVGLPTNGIKPTVGDIENLHKILHIPDNLPKKVDRASGNGYPLRTLNIESRKLIDELPISNIYLSSLVRYYIIFNRFFYDELKGFKSSFHNANVCEITDAQSELDEYAPNDDPEYASFSIQTYIEMLENKLWRYPIVVRVHSDASQRDVVEFIKEHWNEINYYQSQYADRDKAYSFKNSKTKVNQKNKERDNFIYRNGGLSSIEILKKLNSEMGILLDQGHILKILSLERKKREKK